ncbi:MAG: hypothetical protein IKC64_02015 [Clostridia bacterium]|nr:hypothetical protein [Clostridia bacterium]
MDIDDDLFIKRANESLVKTIEFANLGYIMANEGKIEYSVLFNKFVRLGYALDKVVQRAYDIEDEDECFKLAEKIDDTVDTLGSAIIVQDAKYWTCLVKTFKLGEVEEFEERIKTDINNAPTEPATEEVDFFEKNYDLLKSVFESAIKNKLDAISPTWVMRNFFVGYNKSV